MASVFVSRIDTATDKLLQEKVAEEGDAALKSKLESLFGKAAVANSAAIYKAYKEVFFNGKFKDLKEF